VHLANKLQLLQNSATRSILGAFRTSPTTALDAEAGLLPANLRLNYNQTRLAARILRLPNTHLPVRRLPDSVPKDGASIAEELIGGCPWDRMENRNAKYTTSLIRVLARLNRWLERNTILEQQGDYIPMSTTQSLTITILETPKDRATLEHKALLRTINLQTSIVAYTDGSLLETKAGAGIYIYGNGLSIKLAALVGEQCEVFDAELSAMHLALMRITKEISYTSKRTRQIWLFSDSQAAIQCLQHNRPGAGHQMATAIHQTISKLYDMYHIHTQINWVPGHTDVEGNKIADSLAKAGSQLQQRTATPTSLAWLHRQIKANRLDQWEEQWKTARKGASYKGEPQLKLDNAIIPLRKFDSSTIVQLRTGHGYFNSYLATKSTARKKIPSTRCNC